MKPRRPTCRLLVLALVVAPAWGAPDELVAWQVPDSVSLHEEARDAQADFERVRLRGVPEADAGWGGSCDELLGRLCLRLTETGDWWPEIENPQVVRARIDLLSALARVGSAIPGDGWVLGQRAVYLAEAGTPEETLPLVEPCLVQPRWWCDAVSGFALHRAHRFVEAEAAFDRALEGMSPQEATRWADPRPLMDRDGRELMDRTRGRREVAARFWALSDPLFLVPGNDRWTEHLARRVEEFVREDGRNGYGLRWGDDLAEALVRYGPEAGWEVRRPRPGEMASAREGVGHHHPESRSHVAPGRGLEELGETSPGEWNPGERYLARSGYAPSYAPVLLPAAGVLRMVPRGDEVVVLALIDVPRDTSHHADHGHPPLPRPNWAPDSAPRRYGLFALDTLGRTVAADRSEDGRALIRLGPGEYLLSAEAWAPDSLLAGRIRGGFTWAGVPRDVPVVSDLLLADPMDPAPPTLEALVPHLRTGLESSRIAPGETVAVAWEIHGLGWQGREEIRYELVFEGTRGGFFTRAGRALGLVGDPWEQQLAWREPGPETTGPYLRTAALTLPPEMEPGDYSLRLTVRVPGRESMVTEQPIRVAWPEDEGAAAR